MQIILVSQSGENFACKINLDDDLMLIIRSVDRLADQHLYLYNGVSLKNTDTPRSLGMKISGKNYIDIVVKRNSS